MLNRMATGAVVRCLVIMVLGAIANVPTAAGQTIDGLVPRAMSSRQFNADMQRLELDWSQRLAVERVHEEYKREYAAFVARGIAPLLDQLAALQLSSNRGPMVFAPGEEMEARDIERFDRLHRSATAGIRQLDRTLFESIAAHLRPEQMAMLGHIERARERTQYDTAYTRRLVGQRFVNLASILNDLELTAEEQRAIGGILTDYEVASNRAIRTAHDQGVALIAGLYEELERAAASSAGELPEKAVDTVYELAEDVDLAAQNVRALTERSFAEIEARLPAAKREQFRLAYQGAAHPRVYRRDAESPRRMFDLADEMADQLPRDVLDAIREIEEAWSASHDAASRSMIPVADDLRRHSLSKPAESESGRERLEELRTGRTAMNARTSESILALLTDEDVRSQFEARRSGAAVQAVTLSFATSGEVRVEGGGTFVVHVADGNELLLRTAVVRGGGDARLPGPVTSTEFAFYADRLGIGAESRVIAEGLLHDYNAEYLRVLSEEARPLVAAAREKRESAKDDELAEAIASAGRRARTMLAEIDAQLFDDLGLFLSDEQLAQLPEIRTARDCIVHDVTASTRTWMAGSSGLNLARILPSLGLESADVRSIHPILTEYDAARLPVLKQQFEAAIRRESTMAGEAAAMELRVIASPEVAARRYERAVTAVDAKVEQLAVRRQEIDREFGDRFIAALPAEMGERLAMRIKGETYPEIWPDPDNADRYIERAMAIEDLSNDQRLRLEVINADHGDRHEALCFEMMRLEDERLTDRSVASAADLIVDRRRAFESDLVRNVREEWNETSRRRARALLSEGQAKGLPELPAPPSQTRATETGVLLQSLIDVRLDDQ